MDFSRSALAGVPSSIAELIAHPAIMPRTSARRMNWVRRLAMRLPFARDPSRPSARRQASQRRRASARAFAMADGDRQTDVLQFGREILHDEARALDALAESLDGPFEQAVRLILDCPGKVIVSGLGKSGHVARKIAATFASTGTTATFLHLAEAIHGDLGMAAKGDVAMLISLSGETAELEPVIDHFARVGIPIVAITGNKGSMLAQAAAAALVLPHWPE